MSDIVDSSQQIDILPELSEQTESTAQNSGEHYTDTESPHQATSIQSVETSHNAAPGCRITRPERSR